VTRLIELPGLIEKTLALDPVIRQMADASSSTMRCSSGAACITRSRSRVR
jgi:hypothetical protein